MNKHRIALLIKKVILGKKETYTFANKKLKFLTGTRPIKRKYITSNNDVDRNDVLQIEYFEKNFKPTDVLWDIGSHNGHYSIFTASIARGENQIFSFEPDIFAYKIQEKNIQLNSLQDKIKIMNIVVSNNDDHVYFETLGGNANSHIIKGTVQNKQNVSQLESKTLNTLSQNLPTPSFVKIDTEGAEIDILSTASNLLQNKTIKFICELHPFAWRSFGVSYSSLVDELAKYGRTIKPLDPNKKLSDLPFYGTVIF